MPPRPRALAFAVICLAGAAVARAQATLPPKAFSPPADAATVATVAETIEFAGVTTVGKSTDLIFYDKTAKKSRTVPLGGETVEGIQVLRYEADKQQAVVKINGAQKTLPLRKGAGPVNAPNPVAATPTGFNVPSPAPLPTTPALANTSGQAPWSQAPAATPALSGNAPAQPVTTAPAPVPADPVQRQEQEARMLVSDLLEIGMAQRKAYEEAQRRAQEGGANPATPASANVAPAATAQPVPPAPGTPPK